MPDDSLAGTRPGDDGVPTPKTWGRRPYADKSAREVMNDVSARIARDDPDHVDDPGDPSMSDVLGAKLDVDVKAVTLTDLMAHDLTFQEAVMWYWFRVAQFDMSEIHYAQTGHSVGGDPALRRNSVRNIQRVLKSAAAKLPGFDVDDVPDLDVGDGGGE